MIYSIIQYMHSVDPLCLIIYISTTKPKGADDLYRALHGLFLRYRVFSPLLFLSLVTVFAAVDFDSPLVPLFEDRNAITIGEALGLSMLVYAWVASCVWPCVFGFLMLGDELKQPPPRDLAYYINQGEYEQALSLGEFGAVTVSKEDRKGLIGTLLEHFKRDKDRDNTATLAEFVVKVYQRRPEDMKSEGYDFSDVLRHLIESKDYQSAQLLTESVLAVCGKERVFVDTLLKHISKEETDITDDLAAFALRVCQRYHADISEPHDISKVLRHLIESKDYQSAQFLAESVPAVCVKDQRVLAELSESFDKGDPVGVLPLLHTLCLKYPKQVDAEHKLYPLEQAVAKGGTLCHVAVQSEAMFTLFPRKYSSEVLSTLLERKMGDVDAVNDRNESALHVVANNNPFESVDAENVSVLIRHGIDTDLRDADGKTAMARFAQRDDAEELLRHLIKSKDYQSAQLLFESVLAVCKDQRVVAELSESFPKDDPVGVLPLLHTLCLKQHKHPDQVDVEHKLFALKQAAAIGDTLCHVAVQSEMMRTLFPHKYTSAVLSTLLERKAGDVNTVNDRNESALHVVANNNPFESVDAENVSVLIRHGIDTDLRDADGKTAMARFAQRGDAEELLRCFIKAQQYDGALWFIESVLAVCGKERVFVDTLLKHISKEDTKMTDDLAAFALRVCQRYHADISEHHDISKLLGYLVRRMKYQDAQFLIESVPAVCVKDDPFEYQDDPVSVLPLLHTLCLKYPEQIGAEHKLFALEQAAAEGGTLCHVAVQWELMRTLFPSGYSSFVLSTLLERKMCDVDAVNAEGESALDVIAQRTEMHVMDVFNAAVLIEGGMDAKHKRNAKESLHRHQGVHEDAIARLIDGREASHYFIFRRVYEETRWSDFEEAVKALAKAASDINAKDGFGNTLLHAVLSRLGQIHAEWVKTSIRAVLRKGADKAIEDTRGRTAKDIVAEWQAAEWQAESGSYKKEEMLRLLE